MRIRYARLASAASVWLLMGTASPTSAAGDDVPAPLMSAVECMARVLRAMPGVSDVEINVTPGKGGAYPVLAYSSSDASGRRRFTELSLFQISGIEDAPFVFDRADIEGDLLAERLLPLWKNRCHAGLGYITSVPR